MQPFAAAACSTSASPAWSGKANPIRLAVAQGTRQLLVGFLDELNGASPGFGQVLEPLHAAESSPGGELIDDVATGNLRRAGAGEDVEGRIVRVDATRTLPTGR